MGAHKLRQTMPLREASLLSPKSETRATFGFIVVSARLRELFGSVAAPGSRAGRAERIFVGAKWSYQA